jgi:hypothetical protein
VWREQSGGRLGYGITLLLTVEVGKHMFSEMLPVCGEMLWIEVFNIVSLTFCYLSLLESIARSPTDPNAPTHSSRPHLLRARDRMPVSADHSTSTPWCVGYDLSVPLRGQHAAA